MKYQLSAIALFSIATSAFAQEAADVLELPTTVVTGDLWESELEKTTASVTVLDEATLDKNGVQHFEDVVDAIPNLTWTGGSSRPRYIQLRGIGENSQFEGETPDSAVRFLIDDLDLTGLGTVGNLFDVQQVEVLRGPQAGAFGANAAGGVIKIVTNEPTPYWTGQIEGTVGNDNLRAGGLAMGGPILEEEPEKLTFRLSLHQLKQDGFRDNKFLGKDDTNARDEFTSRLKLRWLANEDWQWDGTLLYADADNGYDEWTMDNTRFDTYADEPGRDEQESLAGSLRGEWTGLADVRVTSITSATHTDSLNSYDSDWTFSADPRTYNGFIRTDRERDVFSQELRFDSADQQDALGWIDRWTAGLYYHRLKEDARTTYRDDYGTAEADYTYNTDSYSAFGQLAHDFSQTTRLILGLRYEYHTVDMTTKNVGATGGYTYLGAEDSRQSSALWGGKITFEHDLTAEQMVFASFARGYKAAGANGGVFRNPGDPLTYQDETLYNTELGLRSEWFDADLVSQITAFYLYRDQPQLRDSGGSGGFFRYFTDNAKRAKHYGLEAEATWFISNEWTASAGLGLLETENEDGGDLAGAPAYTFHAQLDYQAANGFFANLAANGSAQYYESNNPNNRRERLRRSFLTVNASLGYRYEGWTFTLWGKNLFDEGYDKRVFHFDNGDGEQRYENPANPRTFGITANYSW